MKASTAGGSGEIKREKNTPALTFLTCVATFYTENDAQDPVPITVGLIAPRQEGVTTQNPCSQYAVPWDVRLIRLTGLACCPFFLQALQFACRMRGTRNNMRAQIQTTHTHTGTLCAGGDVTTAVSMVGVYFKFRNAPRVTCPLVSNN